MKRGEAGSFQTFNRGVFKNRSSETLMLVEAPEARKPDIPKSSSKHWTTLAANSPSETCLRRLWYRSCRPKNKAKHLRQPCKSSFGCHFAPEIDPKSLPKHSGAPLERSGVSWSAPSTVSGCCRDAPGTLPGRFWMLPGCPGVALGRSLDVFGSPREHFGAQLTCRSVAMWFQARFGVDFLRFCRSLRASILCSFSFVFVDVFRQVFHLFLFETIVAR